MTRRVWRSCRRVFGVYMTRYTSQCGLWQSVTALSDTIRPCAGLPYSLPDRKFPPPVSHMDPRLIASARRYTMYTAIQTLNLAREDTLPLLITTPPQTLLPPPPFSTHFSPLHSYIGSTRPSPSLPLRSRTPSLKNPPMRTLSQPQRPARTSPRTRGSCASATDGHRFLDEGITDHRRKEQSIVLARSRGVGDRPSRRRVSRPRCSRGGVGDG